MFFFTVTTDKAGVMYQSISDLLLSVISMYSCNSIFTVCILSDAGNFQMAIFSGSCINALFNNGFYCQQYGAASNNSAYGVWLAYSVFVYAVFGQIFKICRKEYENK